jgi:ADP-ribose pyrophosphatase YjhB (NUDIX family)
MWISDFLYHQIQESMPIPCVDLIVRKPSGKILLLKRANEPAKNHWWFPGGRIHHGEARLDAARRKLEEECKIDAASFLELGTFDVFLPLSSGRTSHAITTVYEMVTDESSACQTERQSTDVRWALPTDCHRLDLHNFIVTCLHRIPFADSPQTKEPAI